MTEGALIDPGEEPKKIIEAMEKCEVNISFPVIAVVRSLVRRPHLFDPRPSRPLRRNCPVVQRDRRDSRVHEQGGPAPLGKRSEGGGESGFERTCLCLVEG